MDTVWLVVVLISGALGFAIGWTAATAWLVRN